MEYSSLLRTSSVKFLPTRFGTLYPPPPEAKTANSTAAKITTTTRTPDKTNNVRFFDFSFDAESSS